MNDSNQKSQTAPWTLGDRILNVGKFLKVAGVELLEGIRKDRIPAHVYCYPGIFSALALLAHLDQKLAGIMHTSLDIPHSLRNPLAYSLLCSGWIVWAIEQAGNRNRMLERLQDGFEAASLKCNGRYPSFIDDQPIDSHLRRLRIKTNGVTKTDVLKGIERLETAINATIVRVGQVEGDKSRMDIFYTDHDLPRVAYLDNRDKYVDAMIPIGLTYEGSLAVNLREVGHILAAGQTGGGKSNWLKMVTAILAANNPESDVIFLDFKGGMESADLKQELGNIHENIRYFDGTQRCIKELSKYGSMLEQRLEYLAKMGVANLDDYQKAMLAKKVDQAAVEKVDGIEKRVFLIIDELSQMNSKDPSLDAEVLKKAKAALNRISRQGRAAGVHLIVATQKPDASSFDQTVKANLPGVLCFPMATHAASVSALGTARAFDLNPEIKGRAVWKFGPKMQEVQTYLFS